MTARSRATSIAEWLAVFILAGIAIVLANYAGRVVGALVDRSDVLAALTALGTAFSTGVPLWAVLVLAAAVAAIPSIRRRAADSRRSDRLLEAARRMVADDIARERAEDPDAACRRLNRERVADRAR